MILFPWPLRWHSTIFPVTVFTLICQLLFHVAFKCWIPQDSGLLFLFSLCFHSGSSEWYFCGFNTVWKPLTSKFFSPDTSDPGLRLQWVSLWMSYKSPLWKCPHIKHCLPNLGLVSLQCSPFIRRSQILGSFTWHSSPNHFQVSTKSSPLSFINKW